jgi:hypothetical protein
MAASPTSRLLAGYLCGTRVRRPLRTEDPLSEQAASLHRRLDCPATRGANVELGARRWRPDEQQLADELREALAHSHVVDLIMFGSQARGGTTGFSDVDAILVIADDAADDPSALRALRPHVLAAQRAVLRYQPMQHHGFEVVTPRLLTSACLALPAEALSETCSLRGTSVRVATQNGDGSHEQLVALSASLTSADSWPTHPWRAHRLVAMFELLPTLYLQARGMSVSKWESFALAREDLGRPWWPYEVLEEVRLLWPRDRRRELELGAAVARNPWAAVAVWRRLPGRLPKPVSKLLHERLLSGLRDLASTMTQRAR